MNQPTKTDQRAAERLLKRAVTQAIERLRGAGALAGDLYEVNVRLFETAITAADMLLAAPAELNQEEETAAC